MDIVHYADPAGPSFPCWPLRWRSSPPRPGVAGVGHSRRQPAAQPVFPLRPCITCSNTVLRIFLGRRCALNRDNVNMILFMLLLGGLISLMSVSGATWAFAEWAERRAKTRKGAKSPTGLMVFAFFIDDSSTAVGGAICRPVTDRFQISRAKLAYLLDSTAAPVCVLMPISPWGAYRSSPLGGIMAAHGLTDQSPISAFAE